MWRVPHLFCRETQGSALVWLAATTAGAGFLLFGYDQGVMSGLITLESFLNTFPECRDPDISGITVAIYEIGCLGGAVGAILFGDRLGRKNMIMLGMSIMIVGAIILAASYGLAQFIVGRIVTGVGNGISTATIPSLQSELAPANIRGALILVSGALIATGIALAYAIGLGFYFVDNSATWRFPLAFQIVLAVIVMILLLFIPESPAWLVKHSPRHKEYYAEAKATLVKMHERPEDDGFVDEVIDSIHSSAAAVGAFKFSDLFTRGPTQNFRRALLGLLAQAFQQLTDKCPRINLVSYYATTLFERIGLSPIQSRILALGNGLEYALAAFLCVTFVDKFGRRNLMLIGAIGCGLCMVILTILVHFNDLGNESCGKGAVLFLFLFNTFFAAGWLGMGWLYPSEVSSLPVRAQANGVSTCSNWIWNFVVVMITPPGFDSIGAYTYLIFGIINLAIIAPVVYLFFPETARRSLEEIDLIFAEAYNDKTSGDAALGGYVQHSKNRPPISGRELDKQLQAQLAQAKNSNKGSIEHIEKV
ncbi:sugar porter family MFS transporter [Rhodotorula paludigena]|uniref:sugar porter family MFS transporter n=1 Tax=Rhodotorula paludigena TaxID=86838 RepID=UPI00317F917F